MGKIRGPNPLRSIKQSIEYRNDRPSRTEVLEDEPHKQAIDQLLPQIAAESEQAAKPARTPFLYFRRKRTGRRCSCFDTQSSPDGNCQICFGAGFVGGWDLHGCRTEWIDVTYENVRLVNMKANYEAGIRPVCFEIEEGAKKAFLETEIQLVRNIKEVQKLQLAVGNKRKGATIVSYIKASTDPDFVELTEESLAPRLGESSLALRIEMNRDNTQIPSPRLSHLMLRYKLIPEILMYADMNLAEESFELGDLGFSDAFSTLSLYVPPSFDHLNNEDFLIRMSDLKRFKVTRIERNAVLEILLSHRVMARLLIPGTDSLIYYP